MEAGGGSKSREGAGSGAPPPAAAVSFAVFVRTPDGRSVCLDVCTTETVAAISERALQRSACRQLPSTKLYVSCDGKPLDVLSPLAAYPHIGSMSTLTLKPNVAAIRSRTTLAEVLHMLSCKLADTVALTEEEKLELEKGLADVEDLAQAEEFKQRDVQTVAEVAKALVGLACKPYGNSGFCLKWLDSCSSALTSQFRLALQEAPGNLAPCLTCLKGALRMAVRALECTSKPCRSRVYLGTPWQATSRWALCLLGTLKSEAQTHKFLVWRNATCNTDTHQCCSLLGLLLTTCWRLLAAAVNTLATLLSVEWDCQTLSQWRNWLLAGVEGTMEIAALLHVFASLHSLPQHLSTTCCDGLDTVCSLLQLALDRAMRPSGSPPTTLSLPWVDGLQDAALFVAKVLSTTWLISKAEPTLRARSALVTAAQGLLKHPAMHTVLLQERSAQAALHPDLFKDAVLRDYIPVSAKILHLQQYSDEQSELCAQLNEIDEDTTVTLSVVRAELVESSYAELLAVPRWNLTRHMLVEFSGEPGYGAGVTREWLTLLAAQLFHPQLGLFVRCAGNPLAIMPSPAASVQPNHLQYLQVAGRVMGLCLLHGVPLGFHLAQAFYRSLDLPDLTCDWRTLLEYQREVDEQARPAQQLTPLLLLVCAHSRPSMAHLAPGLPLQLWHTFNSILDASRREVRCMGLTFHITVDHLGQAVEVPLGGRPQRAVTAANREEYVRLALCHLLYTRVAVEVTAFMAGLVDVLEQNPVLLFSYADFNQHLAGSGGTGTVEEWRQHTRCMGWGAWRGPESAAGRDQVAEDGASEEPQVLRWFWVLVGHMNEAQRQALLYFWTSLRSLPFGGFAALPQKLVIVCASHATQRLPQAHTCFYQLLLPEYPDILSLAAGLHEALANPVGFGMD